MQRGLKTNKNSQLILTHEGKIRVGLLFHLTVFHTTKLKTDRLGELCSSATLDELQNLHEQSPLNFRHISENPSETNGDALDQMLRYIRTEKSLKLRPALLQHLDSLCWDAVSQHEELRVAWETLQKQLRDLERWGLMWYERCREIGNELLDRMTGEAGGWTFGVDTWYRQGLSVDQYREETGMSAAVAHSLVQVETQRRIIDESAIVEVAEMAQALDRMGGGRPVLKALAARLIVDIRHLAGWAKDQGGWETVSDKGMRVFYIDLIRELRRVGGALGPVFVSMAVQEPEGDNQQVEGS